MEIEIHLLRQERARHARLADHDTRGPNLPAVLDHLECEVRFVDLHTRFAHVAVVPAPALHIGDDGIDATVVRWIEFVDRASIQIASRRQIVAPLIFLDGLSKFLIVAQIAGLAGNTKPLAQLRNAGIFHRTLAVEGEHPTRCDHVAGTASRFAAQLRQRGLELLIVLVRRAELIERLAGVVPLGYGRQHHGWIGRAFGSAMLSSRTRCEGIRPACKCLV